MTACIKYNVEINARMAKTSDLIREWVGPFLNRSGIIGTGVLGECGSTQQIFGGPEDSRTQAYVTGRVG